MEPSTTPPAQPDGPAAAPPGTGLARVRAGWVLREPWVNGAVVGATVGVLAFVLVVRMNHELSFAAGGAVVGFVLWATWGAVLAGLPALGVIWALIRLGRWRDDRWLAPGLVGTAYLLAAVMAHVNARLHPELLSASAHRIVRQDAVAWIVAALLVLAVGVAVRRLGGGVPARIAFAVFVITLPLLRLLWQPVPLYLPADLSTRPLGSTSRALLVVAVEGLDARELLRSTDVTRAPHLLELLETGAWGPVDCFQPYLRQAIWTSLATGVAPGRHGVKAHRVWRLEPVFTGRVRLLPWSPLGSRLILPWGLADLTDPPGSGVPPLWARLRASGVPTAAVAWPGVWTGRDAAAVRRVGEEAAAELPPDGPATAFFSDEPAVLAALARDRAAVAAAVAELDAGARDLWVHLEALAVVRTEMEPRDPLDTRRRQAVDLVFETVDAQLGAVLARMPADRLVVVVSPYGLGPPTLGERAKALLRGEPRPARASAERSPDGVLVMAGPGVRSRHRFPGMEVIDVAPTICYLLELPVAQYMEGQVVLDGLDPSWVADRPLRVVD